MFSRPPVRAFESRPAQGEPASLRSDGANAKLAETSPFQTKQIGPLSVRSARLGLARFAPERGRCWRQGALMIRLTGAAAEKFFGRRRARATSQRGEGKFWRLKVKNNHSRGASAWPSGRRLSLPNGPQLGPAPRRGGP